MSYATTGNGFSDPETTTSSSATASSSDCTKASAELKLYQAFIFSVPIFFTFILLLLFYLFYLRRRRVDWASLRMRTSLPVHSIQQTDDISRCELGLKKELRELLPIIVFKESFSVKDTQCSVCLGDYQAEDKLQQIPACGHTFHMDCIDHWLANHTTCPLCRQSLLASAKSPSETDNSQEDTRDESSNTQNMDETYSQNRSQSNEDPRADNPDDESGISSERNVETSNQREKNRRRESHDVDAMEIQGC